MTTSPPPEHQPEEQSTRETQPDHSTTLSEQTPEDVSGSSESSSTSTTPIIEEQPTQKLATHVNSDVPTAITEAQTVNMSAVSASQQVAFNTHPDKHAPSESTSTTVGTFTKPVKRLPRATRIFLIILALLIALGGGTASAGIYYYKVTIQQPLNKIIRPVARSKNEPALVPTATAQTTYGTIKGKAWNILLLGSDNDQKYVFPNVLTQVMMVVHIDTVTNQVTMVSIPRDSWVSVPDGQGMHKIDQAFSLGVQETGKFEDGVRLARQTVEADYGIQIDRYAWVGLDGFAKVIDTLHGVDINVDHPVVDDAYPNDVGKTSNKNDHNAYKRIYMSPGPQHLDGHEALEYARSRHSDLVGDIGRTQRQQQILEALKLKLNVSNLLQNFSQLLTDLSGSVYTDLNEEELLAFANYGRTLLNQPSNHLTLGNGQGNNNYGDFATIYDPSVGADQDVVIPHCDTIQPTINRIFQLGDAHSCRVNG